MHLWSQYNYFSRLHPQAQVLVHHSEVAHSHSCLLSGADKQSQLYKQQPSTWVVATGLYARKQTKRK